MGHAAGAGALWHGKEDTGMHGDAVELQIGWAWRDLTPTRPVLLRGMSYRSEERRVGKEGRSRRAQSH